MARIKAEEVTKVMITVFLANFLFAIALFPWVTNEDISNLPQDPLEKFITLFYFGIITFTTTGYGDHVPKSRRLKLFIAFYIVLAISGAASFFFNF